MEPRQQLFRFGSTEPTRPSIHIRQRSAFTLSDSGVSWPRYRLRLCSLFWQTCSSVLKSHFPWYCLLKNVRIISRLWAMCHRIEIGADICWSPHFFFCGWQVHFRVSRWQWKLTRDGGEIDFSGSLVIVITFHSIGPPPSVSETGFEWAMRIPPRQPFFFFSKYIRHLIRDHFSPTWLTEK